MSERLTLQKIVERHGSCACVYRDADEMPVKAFDKYPPAKKMADELTESTGMSHTAVLVMGIE